MTLTAYIKYHISNAFHQVTTAQVKSCSLSVIILYHTLIDLSIGFEKIFLQVLKIFLTFSGLGLQDCERQLAKTLLL